MDAGLEAHMSILGLELDGSAKEALSSLPGDDAVELLRTLSQKVATGRVRDASNYVCATIARGYVSQANGGAQAFVQSQYAAQGEPGKPMVQDSEVAAVRLQSTVGMIKAQQAGVDLNDDAIKALLKLPTHHASQLLEQVAEKKGVIRDLSNYVCATVARGFHPKESVGVAPSMMLRSHAPKYQSSPLAGLQQMSASKGGGVFGKGKGKEAVPNTTVELIPPDISMMERAVLDLNQRDLWHGQNLDANSLLALRCLPQEQAMDLLGALYSKGSGKGSVSIANPNNYLQAAIAKIIRDGGVTTGRNFTGNQTRQKAAELGLMLEDNTLQVLSRLPLRSSVKLLEAAVTAQAQGDDPNLVIVAEAELAEQGVQVLPQKRPWQQ
mmetsp:Transcript_48521/g.90927  ORF Transcript_48521/g.90927 Transcript_48521/m.90927 type:complete len:381 (+) Transcript_48521:55-1197(+)